jgi:hypothetical protein
MESIDVLKGLYVEGLLQSACSYLVTLPKLERAECV